jgi:glucoside 3-dehydrogenase (cytochrome c) hitch-hiker subunit
MKRRQVLQSSLLGAVGAAVSSFFPRRSGALPPGAREFRLDEDASRELSRAAWKPLFLDEHQNETLIVLSDLVIPETDTPGAKQALVNRFIDLLLDVETPDTQRSFLNSLAYLDGLSIKRNRTAFVHLARDAQLELLNLIAYPHTLNTWGEQAPEFEGHAHFNNLKGWISRAFYSSEIGMRELGWDGSYFHGDLQGCSHNPAEHQ